MKFILDRQPRYGLSIDISLETVLTRIYAHSAWHASHNPGVTALTPDQSRLLTMSIEQGFADLRARFAGYIAAWNWNPNSASDNIALLLSLARRPASTLGEVMADVIIEILSAHALMQFHGATASYFDASLRKHRAQLALLLCQP